jgi:hypothetical protein
MTETSFLACFTVKDDMTFDTHGLNIIMKNKLSLLKGKSDMTIKTTNSGIIMGRFRPGRSQAPVSQP